MTPDKLNRVFYGDNGSSAVEIALKMSFHYWKNQGKPKKTQFVNLVNSYHGETFGALAVGDVALYKETYEPLLMTCRTVESPDCFYREEQESWEQYSLRKLDSMRCELEKHHETIAAVVIEPLIQCAGNMRMYHPVYLRQLRKLCDEFDVHLIADEIAVGFGRTGTMFGCEQAEISPDFLCVGKGLTAGYLPLSAVLTTQSVYDAFYDDYETLRAFLHSHSYTGNPLACGVALATLDMFESENTIDQGGGMSSPGHFRFPNNIVIIPPLQRGCLRFRNSVTTWTSPPRPVILGTNFMSVKQKQAETEKTNSKFRKHEKLKLGMQ